MLLHSKLIFAALITFFITLPLPAFCAHQDVLAKDLPEGIFGYKETVGDKVIPFNWEAKEVSEGIAIKVFEDQKSFYNVCTEDGATIKWSIKEDGKHDIIAERKGNTLHITGTKHGKPYDESFKIDERPWYQPLSFSLGNFLDSEKTDTSFWVIRADNIEVIALTAKKIGEEKVQIGSEMVPTQKVEIRAEGYKSKFWHATYWYRKSDNLFVRYQSVHGLPGTDETIVELVNSPSDQFDS